MTTQPPSTFGERIELVERALYEFQRRAEISAQVAIRAEAVTVAAEVVLHEIESIGQPSLYTRNLLSAAIQAYRTWQKIADREAQRDPKRKESDPA
jgi:hypothetical protein